MRKLLQIFIWGIVICGIIGALGMGILIYGLVAPEKVWYPIEKRYACKAKTWLEDVIIQQQLYYQKYGQYATQWDQLAIPELCPKNGNDTCEKRDFFFSFLGYRFLLELQEDGVKATSCFYNYSLFQAYKSKSNKSNLSCIPRDRGAREIVCPDLQQLFLTTSCK